MVTPEDGPRRRPCTVRPRLHDRDHPPAVGHGELLHEEVVAAAQLDRKRVRQIASGRIRQRMHAAMARPSGSSSARRRTTRRGARACGPWPPYHACRCPQRMGRENAGRRRTRRLTELVVLSGGRIPAMDRPERAHHEARRRPCRSVAGARHGERIGGRRAPGRAPAGGDRRIADDRRRGRGAAQAHVPEATGVRRCAQTSAGTIAHTP